MRYRVIPTLYINLHVTFYSKMWLQKNQYRLVRISCVFMYIANVLFNEITLLYWKRVLEYQLVHFGVRCSTACVPTRTLKNTVIRRIQTSWDWRLVTLRTLHCSNCVDFTDSIGYSVVWREYSFVCWKVGEDFWRSQLWRNHDAMSNFRYSGTSWNGSGSPLPCALKNSRTILVAQKVLVEIIISYRLLGEMYRVQVLIWFFLV